MSRPTGRTSFSVISANARAALRCRSTLSENESVVNAESGSPEKKLVDVRSAIKILVSNDWAKRDFAMTHFRGIEEDQLQPRAHSPVATVHMTVIYETGLRKNKFSMDCIRTRTCCEN